MPQFSNHVMIIAGASSGIGAAMAVLAAAKGAQLVLAARNATLLQEVAARCREKGAAVLVCPTDLTDASQCRRLIAETITHFGRIDTFIYNAGKGFPGWFADVADLASIHQEITLNYLGLVTCLHEALPYLRQTRGRIVGVASMGALIGFPYVAGYNAAKHAMRGFLNSLRVELQPMGVSVTVAYPGAVATEQLQQTLGKKMGTIPTLSPERCAARILNAAYRRRRAVTPNFSGKMLLLFYPLFPRLIDRQLYRMHQLYT
ncbi:MAG: SDR family oxidoreductase [Saprospiraceae bacterium]